MPRAIVYGAGRIGVCLGSCLLAAGWTVTFVGRDRLLNSIKENENKLVFSDFRGGETSFTYTGEEDDTFQYITELKNEHINEGDFILITVKREQSKDVAEELKALEISKKIFIVSFQNGVGNKEIFMEYFPDQTVLTAIFGANVISYDDTPHFRLATTNPALIEDSCGESKILCDALSSGKEENKPYVDCELHEDMESMVYGKLLLNLNNAVNALCGLPLQDELSERSCRKVFGACISEAIDAMKANGIHPRALHPLMQPRMLPHVLKLPSFIYLKVAKSSLQIDPAAKSSMWDDLSSGRKTEINYLNGVVLELGRKGNVPTPVNQAVYDLIKDAEEKGESPRYTPEELLAKTIK